MYIVATFRYSMELELAISDLHGTGIGADSIAAVPLDRQMSGRAHFMDTMHRSDGVSLLDGPAVLGTVLAVLGASLGFSWTWGPIICGLLGLALGALLGMGIDYWVNRKKRNREASSSQNEGQVVLIVQCSGEQSELVKQMLRYRMAMAVGQWGSYA
ncbi:hypothetical protein [Paenibacillus validus]|uniref:hypothetical protein n=1 Tax=Paenibacillus validus TaxID=44253 RepID=UPI003D26BB88